MARRVAGDVGVAVCIVVLGGTPACASLANLDDRARADGSTSETGLRPRDGSAEGASLDAADARRPSDSTLEDAGLLPDSPLPADASPSDSPRDGVDPDADAQGRGFCATFLPPAGASFVCDDFDENPDAGALGAVTVTDGSWLRVDPTRAYSPPNALHVNLAPVEAGAKTLVRTPASPATTFSVQCDVLVTKLPRTLGLNTLFGWNFRGNNNDLATINLVAVAGGDGGLAGVAVLEASPPDGGHDTVIQHPTHPVPSGWIRLQLQVAEQENATFSSTLSINGVVVESNVELAPAFFVTSPTLISGWYVATDPGVREAYFDNVVATWK